MTVLELCVSRAGLVKGARLAEYVAMWSIASKSLGRSITVDELAEWWGSGISRRNAFYRLRDFRDAFPEFDTPQPLADVLPASVTRMSGREVSLQPVDLDGLATA